MLRVAASLALVIVVAGACSSDDAATVRADVDRLARAETPADADLDRVARHGRRALPAVENALHTAEPHGRKNLIAALRRIGDADAIPLLRHVAQYDPATDVRQEAEWTLKKWATVDDDRGRKARAALRELDEARGREETGMLDGSPGGRYAGARLPTTRSFAGED